VLLIGLLGLPAAAAAQTYRWTDEAGGVHYGQGIDSVPERYRAGARRIDLPAVPPPPSAARPAPAAAGAAAPGAGALARISFTPGRRIMTEVRLNGSLTVQLLLDTGADVSVINPRVLAALGLGARDAVRASLQGVTGSTDVLAVRLESMEVQGARVGPVRVLSHDVGAVEGDGLLGRDFLDHFTLTIDNRAGVVTLGPK
jgi:hypothetical protein